MNVIEALFNLGQANVLRRGTFPSKQALVQELLEYIEQFNEARRSSSEPDPPKPSSVHCIAGRDTSLGTCLPHPRRAGTLGRSVRPNQQEST